MTSNVSSGRLKGIVTKGVLTVACATVAFAGLPGFSGGGGGLSVPPTASAQEARSIDSFFDELAPYGDWVEHPGNGYVFIPTGVSPDWRPYTVGQWIWTDEYGWYWESEEPFGWATFHYGRWGYDDDYGWYWVPGDEWAPAWVNWRDSEDDEVTGWSPIAPPRSGYAVGYVATPEPAVEESWVFVPTARMVSPRVYQYAYPVRETVVYVNRTPRRWYLPRDRFYVNRPFARERVVKYVGVGGVPIRRVTVVNTRPAWGVRTNDAIFVYRPRYDTRVVVRNPRVVKKVEVVKKVKVEKTVIKKDVTKKEVDKKNVDVKKTNVKEENRKEADKKQERRDEQAKQERKEQKAKEEQRKQRAEPNDQTEKKARQEQKQRQEAKEQKQQRQEQKAAKQEKQQKQEQKAEKQQRQEQKAAKQEKQQQKAEKQKAKCENNPNKCN